ncbi:PREDICTED: uncharacterized protein LOC104802083 isoform X2 [Tarenaya hassleriana]|uniref:uncharacterized protein LOC104802083 isoform X2 n=1 Tax=Tarenaya hassleriana TaxID=28532 RepID=UPI00053C7E57|nr:PREDICTED: uncharacterized protein LOC104802083 isoform X2 [Tarenaya hassleriana]
MAEMSYGAISTVDPIDHLPLRLLRSEIVPPSPIRSQSSIDCLPDFAGYSWLAYGASTLLVISHLPSPLRGDDSLSGPIFRQVLEVSGDVSSSVTSVSWSPVTPSVGELAVGSGNSVFLFSHDPIELNGSFCWSQNAILAQATKVEAIEWTGSGDGIIIGGTEIVVWKRRNRSWEIAWKFVGDHLQDLVSATWSMEGPFATATSWSKLQTDCDEAGKCVLAYFSDGKSYRKVALRHPQRISMIQWRPMASRQSAIDVNHALRNVLLTCCLDGTVRLWSEIDDGRTRKGGKDVNDYRTSFYVAAVIEINQVLNGNLGRDIFMVWGTQTGGIFKTLEGTNKFFSMEKYELEQVGKCAWLVGYGPGQLVTLWAVHCLDDISPMRLPRVTLWMRQELQGSGVEPLTVVDADGSSDQMSLRKVVVLRNHLYDPPLICSLINLSPRNSLFWSSLYTENLHDAEVSSPNRLSSSKCVAQKVLGLDGHSGKILQVAFHPIVCETEFAASLDVNGLVIIWSSSGNSHCVPDHSIPGFSWRSCVRLQNQNLSLKYTSICWAATSLGEDKVLLAGHVGGIDCFIVRSRGRVEDDFLSHYICTIPFAVTSPLEDGPTNIFAIPLPNSCGKTFRSNKFFLLSVWLKEKHFDALSWRVTFHHFDSPGSSCMCNFHDCNSIRSGKWTFEDSIAGKTICIAVSSSSSEIPEPHRHDYVTSFDVVSPSWLAPKNDVNCKNPLYTLATGQADGSLKLWRSSLQDSIPHTPWELVGMLTVGQSPVAAISLSDSGHKIAVRCAEDCSKSAITIWAIVHLIDSGVFMLEEKFYVDAEVVALKWSAVGNDHLFLGVCTRNEIRVYVEWPYRRTTLSVSEGSSEKQIWQCVAVSETYSAILDFVWGPKAMVVLLHADYISLHRQWLVQTPTSFNVNDDKKSSGLPLTSAPSGSDMLSDISSLLEMVERLQGSLPLYHPQALLAAIYSGNWKRAIAAVRHLIENITSNVTSGNSCTVKSVLNCGDILLSKYYEGLLSNGPNVNDFQWHGTTVSMIQSSQFQTGLLSTFSAESNSSNGRHNSCLTDWELSNLREPLEKLSDVRNISSIEKIQILAIVDLLCEISNPHSTSVYASLDEAGRRFWVAFRYKQLYFARRFGKTASMEELGVDSSMIGWAFHSDCQESLFGAILPNESSWQEMRSLGVGFWYANVVQLRPLMEKLARQQYLKNKNPKDCALLYIALNRIQVLAGLFKISKDEKDKPLLGFLSRNFKEEKNKAAALKNAYVLMGKHQLELAIAFFLLGSDTSSAVNVCVKNLHDEQLALVLCRLVEGRGGPLEHNLITKYILPSALQRGDLWLASLLEWELVRYRQSFLAMVGCLESHVTGRYAVSSNHACFMDPSIGIYCHMLANKNSMKNSIGEGNAAILSRWATLMTATAFSRRGLPLEALECLSTSVSSHGGTDQTSIPSNGQFFAPCGILEPSIDNSSNWVSSSIASTMDTHTRLGLAIQFLSKLLQDHPGWSVSTVGPSGETAVFMNSDIDWYEKVDSFQHKLLTALEQFYQRFSLSASCLVNMMVSSLCSRGLLNVGYSLLQGCSSSGLLSEESDTVDKIFPCTVLCKSVLKTAEDISCLLSHIIAACSITGLHSASCYDLIKVSRGTKSKRSNALKFYFHGILQLLSSLRASIKLCLGSCDGDLVARLTIVLDLVEYCSKVAIAWVLGDLKCLFQMSQPVMISYFHGQTPYEVDMESLKKVYCQCIPVRDPDKSDVGVASVISGIVEDKQVGYPVSSIPEDERLLVAQTCFWKHISNFVKYKLVSTSTELDDGVANSGARTSLDSSGDIASVPEKIILLLGKTLITTVTYLSSHHVKQLSIFLKKKLEKRIQAPTLLWLNGCMEFQTRPLSWAIPDADIVNTNNDLAGLSLMFWNLCVDPCLVQEAFLLENLDFSDWLKFKPSREWRDIYKEIVGKNEHSEPHNQERQRSIGDNSLATYAPPNGSNRDTVTTKENSAFQNPEEIFKRSGELIEALCLNPINHQQAAIASNRKGIIFFNREDGGSHDDPPNYIWSDADWPHNGWANSESTPVPTFVSLGVGLGSKRGAHLGLGGATVGIVSLSKPGKALGSGGAQRVQGYTGSAALGLGWETQEDFEQFVDPPPTVETVSTRAFSSHPTMPLFLVGSNNTHIYLWEFGKNRATATYGVLPAANVPPPYALASISAVQFGPCGHRFASAALDGTVCTWQLEVGGRSNVHPVESSLCFTGHASDVKYISSSGSIVAASGYSPNGVNVVVWDTLAPPTTSQASIICHEGGARSISVFDNDIGSGSISPMIVTGGKNGDLGLHDFRYIATGKTKRHRNLDSREAHTGKSSIDSSDPNPHGMLWYIPKAHLGSVTKICTIPSTSLFLTGSKDGDVKLWDAKAAKMLHHWPKLHDRHTFLQPSTRGYGGIIRAGVTDIQICPDGFLTCGGDGTVKFVGLQYYHDEG